MSATSAKLIYWLQQLALEQDVHGRVVGGL